MLKPFAAFVESFRALSLASHSLPTLEPDRTDNRRPTDSLPAVSRSFPPFLSLTSLSSAPFPYSPIFPSPPVPFPEQGTVRSTSQFDMVINMYYHLIAIKIKALRFLMGHGMMAWDIHAAHAALYACPGENHIFSLLCSCFRHSRRCRTPLLLHTHLRNSTRSLFPPRRGHCTCLAAACACPGWLR